MKKHHTFKMYMSLGLFGLMGFPAMSLADETPKSDAFAQKLNEQYQTIDYLCRYLQLKLGYDFLTERVEKVKHYSEALAQYDKVKQEYYTLVFEKFLTERAKIAYFQACNSESKVKYQTAPFIIKAVDNHSDDELIKSVFRKIDSAECSFSIDMKKSTGCEFFAKNKNSFGLNSTVENQKEPLLNLTVDSNCATLANTKSETITNQNHYGLYYSRPSSCLMVECLKPDSLKPNPTWCAAETNEIKQRQCFEQISNYQPALQNKLAELKGWAKKLDDVELGPKTMQQYVDRELKKQNVLQACISAQQYFAKSASVAKQNISESTKKSTKSTDPAIGVVEGATKNKSQKIK